MTTEKSQNGWPVILKSDSKLLYEWRVPSESGGPFTLPLRRGRAGFVLCHVALWFSEEVEQVTGRGDDFGWNPRRIAGSDEWSNHASATAEDLNASEHASGVRGTFTHEQADLIHRRLEVYDGVIRWGGDYRTVVDEMHWEVNAGVLEVQALAKKLLDTPRGRRLLRANPTQVGRLP